MVLAKPEDLVSFGAQVEVAEQAGVHPHVVVALCVLDLLRGRRDVVRREVADPAPDRSGLIRSEGHDEIGAVLPAVRKIGKSRHREIGTTDQRRLIAF